MTQLSIFLSPHSEYISCCREAQKAQTSSFSVGGKKMGYKYNNPSEERDKLDKDFKCI